MVVMLQADDIDNSMMVGIRTLNTWDEEAIGTPI